MRPFWKYHAIGNDFIIMDKADFGGLDSIQLCDRHKGIGADGVLLYSPHELYAAEMTIINSDGSIAGMCGNGLRCFAHWLQMVKGVKQKEFKVLTKNGPLACLIDDNNSDGVQVHLGAVGEDSFRRENIIQGKTSFVATFVNMGNPHVVLIPEQTISKKEAVAVAQSVSYSSLYDGEANVEVVYEVDKVRRFSRTVVYEKGVGFTLGCGTGAAAIYSVLSQDGASWDIEFPGGTVRLSGDVHDSIMLQGEVVFLYYGELHE